MTLVYTSEANWPAYDKEKFVRFMAQDLFLSHQWNNYLKRGNPAETNESHREAMFNSFVEDAICAEEYKNFK